MIDNPYLGLAKIGLNRYHDCTSLKLPVPCGNCPTCIALRQSYFVQRCQMMSINHHLFMVTLTYRQSMIRYLTVNGRKLYYADFTDIQNMFKRLNNRGYKCSYFCVSEYGSDHHRPHFHMIIALPKSPKYDYLDILNLEEKWSNLIIGEWRRNYGSKRKPIYKQLCQLVFTDKGRTYDFHYVNPSLTDAGEGDVAFYCTKYLLKADDWLDRLKSALKLNLVPEEFEKVWKLLRPRCCCSKSWGFPKGDLDIAVHIRKGIDLAKQSESLFPFFINPVSGQTFPLAPYYQRKFLTVNDKEYFYLLGDDSRLDTIVDTEVNRFKSGVKDSRFERIKKQYRENYLTYNPLYDNEDKNLSAEELEKVSNSTSIPDTDFSFGQDDFDY